MRLLMSSMTSLMACWWIQEPAVSMAIRVKMWVVVHEVFGFAALLAADPAWAEVASKCRL